METKAMLTPLLLQSQYEEGGDDVLLAGAGNDLILANGKSQFPRYGEVVASKDLEWRKAA